MPTPFTKAQGAGNDFVIFDLTAERAAGDFAAIAPALCDRHFGIGADGILLVLPSQVADFRMRVINSDGSEPEMCGNGLRCFVRYLHDRGLVPAAGIWVETLAGRLFAEVIPPGEPAGSGLEASARPEFRVRIDMGRPEHSPSEELALSHPRGPLRVTAVSMGNPHCVTFVDDLDGLPFFELGPLVEAHPRFPRGVNAEFAQVVDRNRIRVKVWERGAGPTLACGTGACAVAVAAASQGLTERRVTVELPGGALDIDWREDGGVSLTGPAECVFTGEVDLSRFGLGRVERSTRPMTGA